MLFGRRKHKTFNYRPRFSEDDNGIQIEDESKDFISKWRKENSRKTKETSGLFSMRFLILALVLLLICMYLLEKKYM
ncbi:hypothetical protein MHTCC0001_06090 [Flavobacteriaceae bacterium MHTCC 0001]